MSEIERLRQELRKARARVTSKINRIKNNSGANVANTDFDPRRAVGSEKRYNKRQLEAHIRQLNAFNQRSVQFVGDASRKPIPRHEFANYKRLEGEVASLADARNKILANLPSPMSDATALQDKNMIAKGKGAAPGPYNDLDLEPSDVSSRSALEKLTANMRKQLKAGYIEDKLEVAKTQLNKALEKLGEQDYIDEIAKLDDYQFDMFWFGTNVAETIFMKYGIEEDRKDGTRKEKWQDRSIDAALDEVRDVLEWAQSRTPEGDKAANIKNKKSWLRRR